MSKRNHNCKIQYTNIVKICNLHVYSCKHCSHYSRQKKVGAASTSIRILTVNTIYNRRGRQHCSEINSSATSMDGHHYAYVRTHCYLSSIYLFMVSHCLYIGMKPYGERHSRYPYPRPPWLQQICHLLLSWAVSLGCILGC